MILFPILLHLTKMPSTQDTTYRRSSTRFFSLEGFDRPRLRLHTVQFSLTSRMSKKVKLHICTLFEIVP